MAAQVDEEARKLATAFQVLDRWLLNGGWIPSDWLFARGDAVRRLALLLIKPNAKEEYEAVRARIIEELGYDAFRALQEESFFEITKK